MTDVKKKIKEYLANATKKNLNFLILSCASFLDKRYSSLSFLNDKKKAEVKKKILEDLQELEADAPEEAVELKTPPPKKKRLVSFDIDGDLDEVVEGEGQAERELKSFELEARLTIEFFRMVEAEMSTHVSTYHKIFLSHGDLDTS